MNTFRGLGLTVTISRFAIGIIELAAILTFTQDMVGLHWILAFPLALVLSYIPVIGNVAAVYASVSVWNWSLVGAILTFPHSLLQPSLSHTAYSSLS